GTSLSSGARLSLSRARLDQAAPRRPLPFLVKPSKKRHACRALANQSLTLSNIVQDPVGQLETSSGANPCLRRPNSQIADSVKSLEHFSMTLSESRFTSPRWGEVMGEVLTGYIGDRLDRRHG